MQTFSISNDRPPNVFSRVRNFFKTAVRTLGASLNLFSISSTKGQAPMKSAQYQRNISFQCRASFSAQEKKIYVADAVRTPDSFTDKNTAEIASRLHDRLALKRAAAEHIIGKHPNSGEASIARAKLNEWWENVPQNGLDAKEVAARNKELMQILKPLGGDKDPGKIMKIQMSKAIVAVLNEREWPVIETNISYNDAAYASTMTPAGQMRTPGGAPLFSGYSGGVCSHTTDEARHAVNLWTTEIRAEPGKDELGGEGKSLFRGLRHAGLSAFGLEIGCEHRRVAAHNRAREIAIAALFMDPEKIGQAMAGEKVDLKLTSTAMLTPFNCLHFSEGVQLQDQFEAWQKLSESPIIFDVKQADGSSKTIQFNVKIAAFNFGVNEGAYKLSLGWEAAKAQNQAALEQLIGNAKPNSPIGGWAAEYLDKHQEKTEVVAELVKQIRTLWTTNAYRRDGGDPYKMVTRIAMLSHLIDVTPCFNCKSGKDRTGYADSEIKHAALVLHETGQFPQPGMLKPEQKELYREVLLNSGNLEVQEVNTGSRGNLVLRNRPLGELSNRERIGDEGVSKKLLAFSWMLSL
ncbi:MAG: type secretion system effector inositol phosphate phosphatase [Herbaspirillum sp.]|jgi:phosphatidylinositol-4,5-bisphosphate 4-phosphatase|nr:type secretion system effector inositol phosphate phosphatase [Herbaspirillum sp.]